MNMFNSEQQNFGPDQIESMCRQQNKWDSKTEVCYRMSWTCVKFCRVLNS